MGGLDALEPAPEFLSIYRGKWQGSMSYEQTSNPTTPAESAKAKLTKIVKSSLTFCDNQQFLSNFAI